MATESLTQAVALFDQRNAADPNRVFVDGEEHPKQLFEAKRLSFWVNELDPQASLALRLAARCQHLERWKVPRSAYPEGRLGYLKWRKALSRYHADVAQQIMEEVGIDQQIILAVRRINLKQNLRGNRDAQTMEDALCLAFLEHDFPNFAAKHPQEKVIDIVRKTWAKMSDRGRAAALNLRQPKAAAELIAAALRDNEER